MEERKLNEKESLELITRMIQNTKDRMSENSGTPFPILFVILLMMGMGTALTGLIVNTKVVTIGGVLGALLSLGCFYMPGIDQILFFALAFVFMMVIPGHYMNSVAKRHKQ